MSEAQRVGQLFLVGIAGAPAAEVTQAVGAYHFGSLLFEGTSDAGLAADRQVTVAIQSLASSAATSRVRFFVAANQEGGQVQELQGPGFSVIPPALAQGQLSAAELRRQAAAWGRQLRSAGVNLDLAPVMDVVPSATASQNQPIGALEREFGYTPQVNGAHGVAFIQGMREAGVAVLDDELRARTREILSAYFKDNSKAHRLGPDATWSRIRPTADEKVFSAQAFFYETASGARQAL